MKFCHTERTFIQKSTTNDNENIVFILRIQVWKGVLSQEEGVNLHHITEMTYSACTDENIVKMCSELCFVKVELTLQQPIL